jgi:lysophospholipase L1-like esterase
MSAITTDIGFHPEAIHVPFTPSAQAPYTDVQRAIDALYSGAPKLPFGSPIVFAGDSITARAFISDGAGYQSSMAGFMTWAQFYSRQRAYAGIHANAGISGNTATQLRARYATDVAAYAPKIVCLLIGTNEMLGSLPGTAAAIIATYITDLAALIAANRTLGARTILLTIPPSGTVGVPINAGQITAWEGINAAILASAASDVTVLDTDQIIGVGNATHSVVSSCFNVDAIHPNVRGAMIIGSLVASAIKELVSDGDYFAAHSSGVVDFRAMPGNGPLADNLDYSLSATIAATPTIEARADGGGQWQDLEFVAASPNAGDHCGVLFPGLSFAGVLNAGDCVQVAMEITSIELSGLGTFGVWLYDQASEESIGTLAYDSVAVLPNAPWSGLAVSPPKILAHNFATCNLYAAGYVGVNTTISGKIRIGRMAILKVPAA